MGYSLTMGESTGEEIGADKGKVTINLNVPPEVKELWELATDKNRVGYKKWEACTAALLLFLAADDGTIEDIIEKTSSAVKFKRVPELLAPYTKKIIKEVGTRPRRK